MFTRWMFYQRRGYIWQRANHHALICNALERVFNGETKRLIINIPPRYSKTEIAVVNFIVWAMGCVPDCEFIHASYSATLAVNNSVQIRNLVQHEEYRAIFPDLALASESSHHWKTTAGGVMYATGTGGHDYRLWRGQTPRGVRRRNHTGRFAQGRRSTKRGQTAECYRLVSKYAGITEEQPRYTDCRDYAKVA